MKPIRQIENHLSPRLIGGDRIRQQIYDRAIHTYMPGGANAKGFAGFSTDKLAAGSAGSSVSLVRGRCRAVAAGAITHGHYVSIAGSSGKVQDCQAAVDAAPGVAADTYVIAKAETDAVNDGDIIIVTSMEFVAKVAAS